MDTRNFERLFYLLPQMLCIADIDGSFKEVNPAFERTLGYDIDELLSRPFIEFVHADDRQRTRDEVQRLAEGIPVVHFENRYRCRDGSYRWLRWAAMPEEQPGLIYAAAMDVTDVKHSLELLRSSERRYEELLAAVTSYRYSVLLPEGRPISTEHSSGCLATTGYTPEEYASQPDLWINMVHPEDRHAVLASIAAVLRGETSQPLEHRILHKDGRVRWVRSTVIPHVDRSGVVSRYDGLVEDITDRKRTERRFEQLVEWAPDAMVIVDQAGSIQMINQQTERLFGYAREELLGQPVEVLVPERFRERHPQQRAAYLANPDIRPVETGRDLYALRKDGNEFLADIRLSPLETEEGMLVSSTIRDITQRRQMEDALKRREAQLFAARKIQQHLLPQCSPALPGIEIAGASYPADFVGGDYFDYLRMPDGSTGIVIADMVGHGLSAALHCSSMHSLMRSLASYHLDVSEILRLVNAAALDDLEDGFFGTALLGRIDPEARSFVYASAGHPPAYMIDRTGVVKACLKATSLPLGVTADIEFPSQGTYVLEPGDVLVLVTDGVMEAASPSGEEFGAERMLSVLCSSRRLGAREIISSLHQVVCTFTHPGRATDDMTLVVVKRYPGSDDRPRRRVRGAGPRRRTNR